MNIDQFIPGKTILNKYVHSLKQNGASFHIHYWGAIPKHYDNLLHKHSYYEVCFIFDGEGLYVEDDSSYKLQKNTIFLSRPNMVHQIKSVSGLSIVYIGFELVESESGPEWIKLLEEAAQCTSFVKNLEDESVSALLWKSLILKASKMDNVYAEGILKNIAFSLILSLLQTFVPYSDTENKKSNSKRGSALLHQAVLFIQDNLSNSIKLTDLANCLHISSRHLSRLFVSELGLSYSDYVRNQRIRKAAILLKETESSIKEIAEQTGFPNVHYFTRVFTSAMGSSPGLFRSLYISQKTTTYKEV
ncbi:AraC family transcriptional regulator [Alkalihalobacillus sp. MEB130]|uniref:AraC family transcriptional regulator n=1 Tax=Alkalihalobacillus sp. MEB130 TaxID=2976704 RepID=UPI0028DF1D4B|nr:AraC family transcriptional regulator [Alkalihalobacillus sp. MEB130]MDT8859260.1 AraC family transcriptional regulator [Alkalihalobacillus sp. MEB130]